MPELMKGQKYSDRFLKGKLRYEYPVIVEEKRDEIRAHFKVTRDIDTNAPVGCHVVSYAGKPLYNLEAQCASVFAVMQRFALTELDCGVEVNGSYDDTYRYLRSKHGVPPGLRDAEVVVLLFDVPEWGDVEYGLRIPQMLEMVKWLRAPWFHRPRHWVAEGQADEDVLYAQVRREGIEGLMIKMPRGKYERKRSWNWFKRKPDETHDGVIVELHEAICGKDQPELGLKVGDKLGRIGSVTLQLEDDTFATPHGIPHKRGRHMLENPEEYVGRRQWVEFSCMERDRQGGYRHPVFKRLREAKA